MYYNTTSETGGKLELHRASTTTQLQRILALFQTMPERSIHAWQIQTCLGSKTPITSVRRAISDLAKEGKLICTGSVYAGPYQRKTYTYKFFEVAK